LEIVEQRAVGEEDRPHWAEDWVILALNSPIVALVPLKEGSLSDEAGSVHRDAVRASRD